MERESEMNGVMKHIGVAVAVVVALAMPEMSRAAAGEVMLVCNFFGNTVSRFDVGSGALLGTLDAAGGVRGPLCARMGPDGKVYVASEGDNSIKRFNADTGAFVDSFVVGGALTKPTGLTWDAAGDMYVSSFDKSAVLKYDGKSGAFKSTFVSAGQGGLSGADNGMTFGPDGSLYVPSYNNNRVIRYGADGSTLGTFLSAVGRPRVLEFRGDVLYVTSETVNNVLRFDAATGQALPNLSTSTNGIRTPIGLAFGTDGSVYVGSSDNNRIIRINGQTGAFMSVFADPADGILGPAFITIIPTPSVGTIVMLAGVMGCRRRRYAIVARCVGPGRVAGGNGRDAQALCRGVSPG